MEDALIPVAVTGFDLLSMGGKIITSGSMAGLASTSATFPGLFQPVPWREVDDKGGNGSRRWWRYLLPPDLLIDGGVFYPLGLMGMRALNTPPTTLSSSYSSSSRPRRRRVLNLLVGTYGS